jgi:ATP-dependent helicase/nuclease subunit A
VKALINAIQFLIDPMNDIARLNLAYYYNNIMPARAECSYNEIFQPAMSASNNNELFGKILPKAFINRIAEYKGMPVNELISSLISDLGLNNLTGEFPYLLGFQDAVQEFSMKERSDIRNFLEWWDEDGSERSITLPQNQEAARIMTIHKSKGLEFRIVVIPFCNWKFEPDGSKNNILWVEAGKTIRELHGHLPLKYSSRLSETFYDEEYYREKLLSFIDNLNLTYVAFTRAAEALVVFAPAIPQTEKAVKPDWAGKLIYSVLRDIQSRSGDVDFKMEESLNDENEIYTLGKFPGAEPKVPEDDEVSFNIFASSPWHSKISFHKIADNAFLPDVQGKSGKNTGIAIHDILSRIITKEDIDKVFKQVISEGIITAEQENEIRDSITRLWEIPVVSDWFMGTWTIKTEAPVIPAPGELNRMDRVMIRDKKAIVVDYKTGKPREKDVGQVKEYLRILADMNYSDVEGYLLYIDEAKLVKVQ